MTTEDKLKNAAERQRAVLRVKMHRGTPERHGTIEDYQERERVANANHAALVDVLGEFNVTINAKEFSKWRPTKRATGDITGIASVFILATDGNLGLFYNEVDGTRNVFFGHIQHFDGKVAPLYSVPAPSKPYDPDAKVKKKASSNSTARVLSKRDERIAIRVMELLDDLND